MLEMFILLSVVGAFAGLLAGLFGVGGGMVLVPAFFYSFTGLGYAGADTMQVCLATSLATIVVTSLRSLISHHRQAGVDWELLKLWAPGIALVAVFWVLFATQLRSITLQWIFGGFGLLIGFYMVFGRSDWSLGTKMPSGWARALLSPMIGFISVLMGIGGGSLGVPLMTLHGKTIHQAVATSSGFGLLIAAPSVVSFFFVDIEAGSRPPYSLGAVNLVAFGLIIAMTLITTPLGVRLAHRLDAAKLRRIFAIFICAVALNMLRKAIGY